MLRPLTALRRLLGMQLELPLPGAPRIPSPPVSTITTDGSASGGPPPGKRSSAGETKQHHFIPPPINPTRPSSGTTTTATAAASFLDHLRSLGLTSIRRLVLTNNQSTVVSFHGDQLRVHRAFVDAPHDVLTAIVDFVKGRGVVRRRARRILLAFDIPRPTVHTPRRRREAAHPDDAHLTDRLVEAHRQLNHDRFQGTLGDITIRVSRRMRSRLGHFSPGHGATPPEIAIARRHLRRDGWTSALDTLAHEMVHQWQYETNRPLAHDREFRSKARQIGIHPAARRMAGRSA